MEDALVGGAVAHHRDDHVGFPGLLECERGARRDGQPAARDAVRAEKADLERGHVLRAAAPARVSRLAAEDLRHDPSRLAAFGEEVSVTAVGAAEVVLRLERSDDAHGHRFLSDAQVTRPRHLTFEEKLVQPLLEPTDQEHVTVEFLELRLVEIHLVL